MNDFVATESGTDSILVALRETSGQYGTSKVTESGTDSILVARRETSGNCQRRVTKWRSPEIFLRPIRFVYVFGKIFLSKNISGLRRSGVFIVPPTRRFTSGATKIESVPDSVATKSPRTKDEEIKVKK
jgi:hypothetical protein